MKKTIFVVMHNKNLKSLNLKYNEVRIVITEGARGIHSCWWI